MRVYRTFPPVAPVSRRCPKIEQIRVMGSFKPEPALSKDDYEEILGIMKNMARVMKLSPPVFERWGKGRCISKRDCRWPGGIQNSHSIP
jgi:hypothetical protein